MSSRLIGDRIPNSPFLASWAAEKCELCGKELGVDYGIRCGAGNMGYQHIRCAFKTAAKALEEIFAIGSAGRSAAIAKEALAVLGLDEYQTAGDVKR
jgi:hypothetical protein